MDLLPGVALERGRGEGRPPRSARRAGQAALLPPVEQPAPVPSCLQREKVEKLIGCAKQALTRLQPQKQQKGAHVPADTHLLLPKSPLMSAPGAWAPEEDQEHPCPPRLWAGALSPGKDPLAPNHTGRKRTIRTRGCFAPFSMRMLRRGVSQSPSFGVSIATASMAGAEIQPQHIPASQEPSEPAKQTLAESSRAV